MRIVMSHSDALDKPFGFLGHTENCQLTAPALLNNVSSKWVSELINVDRGTASVTRLTLSLANFFFFLTLFGCFNFAL